MADRANFVVVRESGECELYLSRWGSVGLDLDLLAGPAEALSMVQRLGVDDWWLDDVYCQGAALIDLGQKVLLLFVWEGPSTVMRYRTATLELLREAWPGWTCGGLTTAPPSCGPTWDWTRSTYVTAGAALPADRCWNRRTRSWSTPSRWLQW
ncbi:hypothetical protein [Streptomyces sp. NPDC088137]|uniref:hypothetical protein n=1 Tax=Streptomyces sp. NPDC088137 TaxID=3365827 RepID=UPI00381BFA3E